MSSLIECRLIKFRKDNYSQMKYLGYYFEVQIKRYYVDRCFKYRYKLKM
ncbi:hypothetical protein ELI_1544 [Eubacterium callanderi]|uniref:Uncharacterized protein n=1 Tax=Eubacterium callanderi TaxID=53442 RepID=E3GLF7_9FIRM|nr:hypothetical protein ELI_1544 [Eubacterium callanderi]